MSASSLRVLLISSDSGLRDRLRKTVDQNPGKTYSVEWVDSFREAMGALTRQEYDIYFLALNGGQDEAATILQQASTRGWAKPILFLSERMSPEVRCQLLRSGAAGCLSQDQLNAALLEYAIEHALEFARAARLLHQSEAEAKKLALVASRTENLVVISDREGRIEWVNEAFTRITGYTLQEVQGARPGSFLQGPETDGATVAYMRECLSEGKGFNVEVINYSRSGRKYWVQIEVQPVCDDSGEITGFTAIESEITERKRIEEELRLRDRAMGAAAEGIVISDPHQPDNPLIYVNDGFERLTGHSRSEVLGRNCRFLQGPGTDTTALELIRECIRERRECHVELLNYRKDGTPFWNRLSIAPLRDAKGRLTHFVGVQSDITARKLAEERLAAANTEILASNNRMKRDLEAAAKVQQALLPTSLPRIEGLEFAWLFKPTAELAGDQLNIMPLDETHIALYLLDVSGHGVPSSLMAVAASLLLSRRRDISTPAAGELVERTTSRLTSPAEAALVLNQQFIQERTAPQYLTLVYGMLNVNSGEFRYVSAGHPGPILVPKDAPPLALEAPTGLPIGLLAASYEERSVILRPGDRVYLYSDGVTEAMNASEEQFGVQRLLSRLCQVRELSLKESLNAVSKSLEEWRCHDCLRDDVSLVALEWMKESRYKDSTR
jgi:PAS domain S-box-containing protein